MFQAKFVTQNNHAVNLNVVMNVQQNQRFAADKPTVQRRKIVAQLYAGNQAVHL